MAIPNFEIGAPVECFIDIDIASTLERVDPDVLILQLKDPLEDEVQFEKGVSDRIEFVSEGSYRFVGRHSIPGDYVWRWFGENPDAPNHRVQVATGIFHVNHSPWAGTEPPPGSESGGSGIVIDGGTP